MLSSQTSIPGRSAASERARARAPEPLDDPGLCGSPGTQTIMIAIAALVTLAFLSAPFVPLRELPGGARLAALAAALSSDDDEKPDARQNDNAPVEPAR